MFSVTERPSMHEDLDESMSWHRSAGELGPPRFGALKAVVTRTRSVRWLLRGRRTEAAGIRILFYHRISDDRDELAVAPARFREQMQYLVESGYRGVDVGAIGRLLDGGSAERAIGLSFDDAYRDVVENALPVLSELDFTATVFVPTGAIDGSAPFGWYRGRQPPVLDWAAITELDKSSPFSFEAHSISHLDLRTLDDARAAREIAGSKEALEGHLGRPVAAFCYPAGLFGARERALVAEAGYEIAVSCEPGANTPATDRLSLHRIPVDRRDSLLDFRARVAGAHDSAPWLRRVYRRARYGRAAPAR
jgi:peptidoglycan/xylan/chitin deacetylase (PgdA/CDA1 family)